jgi:hypothetical protein
MTERRIDVETVLADLKDFQRRTARWAFERMFADQNPAIRFLARKAHDRDRHGVEFVVICIWYQQIQSHKEPPRGNTLYYRATGI